MTDSSIYEFTYRPPAKGRKGRRYAEITCRHIRQTGIPGLPPRVKSETFRVGAVTVNKKPISIAVHSGCDALWPSIVRALHPTDYARIKKNWPMFN
jgi:hypothetical protein